jgi:hypothetical protein
LAGLNTFWQSDDGQFKALLALPAVSNFDYLSRESGRVTRVTRPVTATLSLISVFVAIAVFIGMAYA